MTNDVFQEIPVVNVMSTEPSTATDKLGIKKATTARLANVLATKLMLKLLLAIITVT